MPPIIAGIGQARLDLLGVVPPDGGAHVELAEVSLQGGGSAATALAAASALGCGARLCCKVGDDDFGRQVRGGLVEAGIDDAFVRASGGRLSPFAFHVLGGGRRQVFWTEGDVERLAADEVDVGALLAGASALLSDGHHPAATMAAARAARQAGLPVVLRAGALVDGLQEILPACTHVVASERVVNELAPRGEVEDALRQLRALGCENVIVTLGREGSVGLVGGELVRQPAFEVRAVDVGGAGDVYAGAFLAALLLGRAPAGAMRLAAAAAALSCRALGSRAGLADMAEVTAFLGEG